MSRFDAASGAPSPGQRYRIANPSTCSSAAGMRRYSSRSPARRLAGSNATSICPNGSANVPPRRTTSDAVLRHEPRHEAPVVEIGGETDAGIEPARGAAGPFGKEEGVGVDDGGHLIARASCADLPVQEGQLGQAEQEVRVAPRRDHGAVQLGKRGFGTLGERVEEAQLEEHVAGRQARLARGDGAASEVAVDDLRIDPGRLHRTGAGGEGQTEDYEEPSTCWHEEGGCDAHRRSRVATHVDSRGLVRICSRSSLTLCHLG